MHVATADSSLPLVPRQYPLWFWVTLLAILAAGVWLRVPHLGASLWLDELHTDWATRASLREVAGRAAQGNQPPLYFWSIWLVRQVLDSEIGLRLPSLLASCVLPLALVGISRRFGADGTEPRSVWLAAPLLTAWFWATDDLAIFFAQEARPYASVQLLAVLQFGVGWALLVQPSAIRRTTFWLLSLALIYSHYTAGILLLGELVAIGLSRVWGTGRCRLEYGGWMLVGDAALFALLLTPCLPNAFEVFAHRNDWQQFVSISRLSQLNWLAPALVASSLLLLFSRIRPFGWMTSVTFLAPATLAFAATWLGAVAIFFPRYLAAILPLGWLVIALVPTLLPRLDLQRGAILLLALLPLVTSEQLRHALRHGLPYHEHDEDWRAAAAYVFEQVSSRSEPTALLIYPRLIESQRLDAHSDARFRSYLLFPVTARYQFAPPHTRLLPLAAPSLRFASPADRDQILALPTLWLIARLPPDSLPVAQHDLQHQFPANHYTTQTSPQSFGGIQVWQVRLRVVER